MFICKVVPAEHPEHPDAFPGGDFHFERIPAVGEHIKFRDDEDDDIRHLGRVIDVVHAPSMDHSRTLLFVSLVEWPAHIQKADF